MLSEEELRKLANGEGGAYHFDLSNIQGDYYERLLKSLQTYALKKIDSLGFTCDELARTKGWTQTPIAVLNSIACVKFHFMRNIVALLCHVLPRTQSLKELTLSNVSFKKEHWERLVAAISRSTTLERLNISHVPIGVDGLRLLVQEMDPNQIRSVSIAHCRITEDNVNDIIAFIYRKDDMIVYAGMNIYPKEIEEALKSDVRVEEVLAYGIPHPFAGQAIAVKVKGSFADKKEVEALCRKMLPAYEQPMRIELVTDIPKNATGKMIRRKV